jgi:sulfatase modifying factor 1
MKKLRILTLLQLGLFIVLTGCEGGGGSDEQMVEIPGGTNIGTDTDYGDYSLTMDTFYMDKYEVTNDEMIRVMQWAYDNGKLIVSSSSVRNAEGSSEELLHLDESYCRITWNGSSFCMKPLNGSGYPCLEVTWHGAAAYCNYRSLLEGRTPCYNLSDWRGDFSTNGYRLPTNDEWEYAARGGVSGQRFPWGNTVTYTQANYDSEEFYSYDISPVRGYNPDYDDNGFPCSSPVGAFEPNGYGLYDMAGNVWEWCNTPAASEPFYIIRGGSWFSLADDLRCGREGWYEPSKSCGSLGFRTVRR